MIYWMVFSKLCKHLASRQNICFFVIDGLNAIYWKKITAWKVSLRGPYFPSFRLNTERYGVSLRIQSEYLVRIFPHSDWIRRDAGYLFSRIRTEYGEIRSISSYSVRIWENTDQKKLHIWILFTQWNLWRPKWWKTENQKLHEAKEYW